MKDDKIKIDEKAMELKKHILSSLDQNFYKILIERKHEISLAKQKLNDRLSGYRATLDEKSKKSEANQIKVDVAIAEGRDPQAIAREVRELVFDCVDLESWIEKTEVQIKVFANDEQKITNEIYQTIQQAIKQQRALFVAAINVQLQAVNDETKAWALATQILNREIAGLPAFTPTMSRFYVDSNPAAIKII